MKILLLNQFFWPDTAATSQLLTDLARGLQERGHEVYAICADGGYAIKDVSDPPPVKIHRVKAIPFMRGSLGRVLSYASFFLTAAVRGLTLPKPDLVITLTTPPLLSLIGNVIKIFRGSRHFIWEMDVYPDVAVDLSYFKADGVLDRVTGLLADFSRHKADGILALGSCMRERLLNRGIDGSKIHVAENWADGSLIQPLPRPADSNALTVLYSGNLGLAHDIDTIFGAMKSLKHDSRFRFVFAGSGPLRKELERACGEEQIETAEFRSYSQRASLSQSLASGDIGLVTQRESCLGSVVPSKVYGLLAAGRPILYVGPAASTVAEMIRSRRCGWQVECNASADLTALLLQLADQPSQVEAAGQRSRQAFVDHYDLPLGVARICALVGASPQPETSLTPEVLCTHS
ncbi:MAG TPA: glycosyltransferase family 4 protein [Bryobacteraceae bacterium]|nr:glycosyltransferase family 4 protein [Bryobacteraceae bacterium]